MVKIVSLIDEWKKKRKRKKYSMKDIIDTIDECLSSFFIQYGFIKKRKEYDEKEYFLVIYASASVKITFTNYYRDLMVSVANILDEDSGASIWNVINYYNRSKKDLIEPNCDYDMKDAKKGYVSQILVAAQALRDYFSVIIEYCNLEKYEENRKMLREFVLKEWPDLFKTE